MMRYILLGLTLLFVAASAKADEYDQLETNISSYGALAYTTNVAIGAIIERGCKELEKEKQTKLAEELRKDWKKYDGYLINAVVLNRDIGWYKPLIEWLALAYETIELAIGIEAARAIRISDLKTINHGIVVVFRPCYFGLNEFKLHFIHDNKYRGFAPVISYWAAAVSCTAALHGAGYYFVCSPAASVIERVVDKRIAPKVAPKLYEMACST